MLRTVIMWIRKSRAMVLLLVIFCVAGYCIFSISSSVSHSEKPLAQNAPTVFAVSKTSLLYEGTPYTPYGVTVFGLASTDWESNEASDTAQINAAASFWHANTVRIQVAPSILDANTNGYRNAIQQEVSLARSDGLNVIISAQYERTTKIPGPDNSTVAFWNTIAPLYASDPHVWFDLFNEPSTSSWDVWRNGGDGQVGMQSLVNTIRAKAPNTIILAEGIKGAASLTGVTKYLLTGGNIIYAVHPYFHAPNNSPTGWDTNWGDLTTQIPVIVGEWGESSGTGGACVSDAPTLVPEFMQYVKAHNVGLIGWALIPGVMIRGTDLENPTAFDPHVPYVCANLPSTRPNAQGSGADIRALFMSS